MFPHFSKRSQRHLLTSRWTMLIILTFFFAGAGVIPARAQNTFNSGSTGADGAFAPTSSQSIQVPESGVFNFTTVDIPNGVTIKFLRNSRNSPVTILASGNVNINGGFTNLDGQAGNQNGGGGMGGVFFFLSTASTKKASHARGS